MGKKSKRKTGNSEPATKRGTPATDAQAELEEETKDNLRFEDPFVDELIEEEDVVDDDEGMEDDDEEEEEVDMKAGASSKGRKMNLVGDLGDNVEVIQSWHPLMGHREGDDGEELELEMDPSAYKMYQTLTPEWPSLSFDLLRDNLGDNRQRFPHSLQAVFGTQADTPDANQVTVLKLSDLSKMPQDGDDEEDILGDAYDKEDDGGDSDSDEDDQDLDLDPILEHYSLPHYGGVNRLRAMPQNQNIVATWSDVGKINIYDIGELRDRFEVSEGRGRASSSKSNGTNGPFFTYDGHSTEGFAVDWSRTKKGALATGDNEGSIHLWSPHEDGSSYTVTPSYETPGVSIEDLQWSPSEETVFSVAESNGHVAIYDTRAPNRTMLRPNLHPNTDVNVLSWNKMVSNLLATGADDGTLCVWDLRHFGGDDSIPKPLARFTCHRTPVTSVEWHPTDESMLAMSDEVGVYIYDLSVEEDIATQEKEKGQTEMEQLVADIPPQLLFCHSGSKQFKECHWHPQISSCVMTTAYSGFSTFIPSNL
uniref:Histone-binding protein RBBP4-like N-terminal domain-containing protein n=1 Tax=Pseudo-nitzschia australis TaxID=44445 RepID=A0A7S4ALY1_9STRA|mmetsp:Transcript_14812/g.31639  ORF Transcript_14812/g.31639 Transcript_14812/m.31639 type:complete len:535 (+) Transcript_14812:137-1741(+)|eukprot:CAMPEP_0168182034 /NCGR_PEP_ID=MMETSP0139_2-20121125/11619_1 /TAXON_ID=44445 /ORGANISM="Pseudo-nitzschia australis, Strain 10249 10 AB" /LENGTH=534 /DNA_ID=CAMNT_0008102819 /DNA_START=28 /DNA_END=1635 /DNA_ORIENTATION=-